MSNIYYEPQDFDLEILLSMDANICYEFNTHVLFKHKDGRLFYGADRGCSCPTPFEDFRGIQDLELVTLETLEELESRIMQVDDISIVEKKGFIDKAYEYLKNA